MDELISLHSQRRQSQVESRFFPSLFSQGINIGCLMRLPWNLDTPSTLRS